MRSITLSLAALVSVAGASAQSPLVVSYPDAAIAPASGQYPVYTPTNGNTVRGQSYCPSSFAGLPKTAMVCTRIGIQISGTHPYATFVGRAGVSPVKTLSSSFATNLPDQRVQFDLSGQNLPGGASANIWVEFPLRHPFVWTPGDNLVVDITGKSQVAGTYCRTAIGAGVPRMLNTSYTATSTTGSVYTSGGIKLRFVFEPMYAPIAFGAGCAGSGNQVPELSAKGSTKAGTAGVILISLSKARPNALAFLVAGATSVDLPVFGGCHIYPSLDVLIPGGTSPTGTGSSVIPVPSSPSLVGALVTLQYAIDDPNSAAAPLPFSLSNGLRLLLQK